MSVRVIRQDLNPKEAAQMAEVHLSTVYRWVYSGILPHYKTRTRRIRIREEDLRAFLGGRNLEDEAKAQE